MRLPALLAVLALAGPSVAQPAPETVDADLLYGFLGIEDLSTFTIGGQSDPKIAVLMPDGAEVLATRRSEESIFGSQRFTVLGRLAESPGNAAEAYTRRIPEGWSVPDLPEPERFGFVTTQENRDSTQVALCSDDESGQAVFARFNERPSGGTLVVVTRLSRPTGGGFYSPCGPRYEAEPPFDTRDIQEELPTLRAPSDARLRPNGGGGGRDDWEQSAELQSDLALAEVAGHFTIEMERAGWTRRGSASVEPDLAVSTWTRESDMGLLVLMLTLRPDGPDSYDLRLSMLAPAAD